MLISQWNRLPSYLTVTREIIVYSFDSLYRTVKGMASSLIFCSSAVSSLLLSSAEYSLMALEISALIVLELVVLAAPYSRCVA